MDWLFLSKRDFMSNTPRKLHNPKSHAPAVYIPCWLIQVPSELLSYAAKIVYGRLSQWSTGKCTVHRSLDQLSQEIGMNKRSLERILKELKDVELIGTYQVEAGGVNHYEFYDHPWMYETINEHLVYQESYPQPPPANVVPPRETAGTPPANLRGGTRKSAVPKIEKIKINKNKSFCEADQKQSNSQSKSDWAAENAKVHDFAESKNQMAREAKHIEEHEAIKRAPIPEEFRDLMKKLRRRVGGKAYGYVTDERGMQKGFVQIGDEILGATQNNDRAALELG